MSEERWAELVGGRTGAAVHKVRAGPGELADGLPALIEAQDEPFGSTSIYAQYRVFRLARESGIKVMLDGQGADELLGGYRTYLPAALASLLRRRRWGDAARFWRHAAKYPDVDGLRLLLHAGGGML